MQGHDEATRPLHHHRVGMLRERMEAGLDVADVDGHVVIARRNVR